MTTQPIVPVILSGGAGTRLWPLSTSERPKQFLPLASDCSMFRDTLARVPRGDYAAPVIVASARHDHLCDSEVEEADALLILEPLARNTAPAIALAALAVRRDRGGDALLLVMPSDHVMTDIAAFHAAVAVARPAAEAGMLVTFGIEPSGPETGYGYIAAGDPLDAAPGALKVARFIEKPPRADAEAMLAAGGHFWNAGIFLFRADAFCNELAAHAPAMLAAAEVALVNAQVDGRRVYADADSFAASPSDSIDYAVMERSQRVAVVPMNPGWSDLGSWDALHALGAEDGNGNRLRGRVAAVHTQDCLIQAGEGVTIAAYGVSDLIIVASGDSVLVLPRGRSQEVKTLLAAMKDMPQP